MAIESGATFTDESLLVDTDGEPIDLTGYTARMAIKETIDADEVALLLTTENSRIIITPATGSVLLYLSDAETAAFNIDRGVYDVELIQPGGEVMRLMQGDVTIDQNVTV